MKCSERRVRDGGRPQRPSAPLLLDVRGGRPLPRSCPLPARIGVLVLLALFFYALPLLRPPFITTTGNDFGNVLFTAAIFALVGVGLNVVIGYAGLLDLGYVGFYAVGAYTVGVLTSYHGAWPFFLTLPVAILRDDVHRGPSGCADPAGARRLPGDRDTRLR